MKDPVYSGKYRISYYDLDYRGKIKLSAFIRMVHVAADVNAIDLGIGFTMLKSQNISFILQRFGARCFKMPEYDDEVTIRTWPCSIARGAFTRKGEMLDAEGCKLMEWASLWILFDIKNRKILKPSALSQQLPEMGSLSVSLEPAKVDIPQYEGIFHAQYTHAVMYRDADTNMHMNNAMYGDLIGNAVFTQLDDLPFENWSEVQINYLSELKLGTSVDVTCTRYGDVLIITGNESSKKSFIGLVR